MMATCSLRPDWSPSLRDRKPPIEEPAPDFDREWARLGRKLAIRAYLRWGGAGFAVGGMLAASLLVWFSASVGFSETLGSFIPPVWGVNESDPSLGALSPESPFHSEYGWIWPWPIWLLPLIGTAVGLLIGRVMVRRNSSHAAWADVVGEGRDSIQTALAATGPFAHELRLTAAKALRRANTTRPPIRGSVKWAVLGMVAFLVGAGSHGWWALTLPEPRERAPVTLADVIAENVGTIGENIESLGEWGGRLGLTEVKEAAEAAAAAKQLLAGSGVSMDDALALVKDMEDKAKAVGGSENAGAVLEELLQSESAVNIGKQLFEGAQDAGAGGVPDLSALEKIDPALLKQVEGMLKKGGYTPQDSTKPGGGSASGDPKGMETTAESVMSGIQRLAGESGLARKLFGGSVNPAEARAALGAGRQMQKDAAAARAKMLAGGSATPGKDEAQMRSDYGVLLKDLPMRPKAAPVDGAAGASQGVDNVQGAGRTPAVAATGRELTANAADYRSQGHRLPRDVRTNAGRYFGD